MQLEKISNTTYGDYFVLHIPSAWIDRTEQIYRWLNVYAVDATFYPPNICYDHLPGLLYFRDESSALAFILRWSE